MTNIAPIATDDSFTIQQGLVNSTVSGNLGADNGFGVDLDPDGSILGWAGAGFNPVGDGDRYLGAFFSGGQLGFLSIQGTVSYPFPVFSTSLLLFTAQGGQVLLNTNGNFTYTSAAGFSGTDWVDYTLVDGLFGTDIGRLTFEVIDTAGGNDKPIAADDAFAGPEDQRITGNLLADNGNGPDSDPNGDTLTVVNRTYYTSAGGIVAVYANGDFIYTPKTNYVGPDSFTYEIIDAHGARDTGTVSLTLTSVNDAPTGRDDSFSASHDQTISGNVLTNDSHVAGLKVDVDGDALMAFPASLSTASGGQVVLLASGDFTYIPDPAFVGTDSFTYQVTDGQGGFGTATVVLNLTNAAPIAATDWFTVQFGKGVSGNLLANNGSGTDSDADGDPLSAAAGQFTTTRGGTLVLNADGSFSYRAPEAFYGIDSFQYGISDGFGGTAIGTVQFSVQAPVGSVYCSNGDDIRGGTGVRDTIFGLDGDDSLSGLGGNDVLAGGNGDDTIVGGGGNDALYGQSDKDLMRGGLGADYLYGGSEGDDLFGNEGNDTLVGGTGSDSLVGGGGVDLFVFGAADAYDRDKVVDFTAGEKLAVYAADYGLAAGALPDASYFALTGAASVGHGRFVYNAAARSLSWDADGSAATADLVVAVFNKSVSLSHTDFLVL